MKDCQNARLWSVKERGGSMIPPVLPWTDTPIMFVSNVVKLTSEERLDVILMRGLEMHSTLRNLFVVVVVMLVRCSIIFKNLRIILMTRFSEMQVTAAVNIFILKCGQK